MASTHFPSLPSVVTTTAAVSAPGTGTDRPEFLRLPVLRTCSGGGRHGQQRCMKGRLAYAKVRVPPRRSPALECSAFTQTLILGLAIISQQAISAVAFAPSLPLCGNHSPEPSPNRLLHILACTQRRVRGVSIRDERRKPCLTSMEKSTSTRKGPVGGKQFTVLGTCRQGEKTCHFALPGPLSLTHGNLACINFSYRRQRD
ncbi:hypothetical protein Bbelb_066790 [Branchiostoma belcheri]|nr:hypothetical protein Bbelb_066790 [Branchiostoma belcheri]